MDFDCWFLFVVVFIAWFYAEFILLFRFGFYCRLSEWERGRDIFCSFNNYYALVIHLHQSIRGNFVGDLITFYSLFFRVCFKCECKRTKEKSSTRKPVRLRVYVSMCRIWVALLYEYTKYLLWPNIFSIIYIFLKYVGYGCVYVNKFRISWVSLMWFIAKDTAF